MKGDCQIHPLAQQASDFVEDLKRLLPSLNYHAYVLAFDPVKTTNIYIFAYQGKDVLVSGYEVEVNQGGRFIEDTADNAQFFFERCLQVAEPCFSSPAIQSHYDTQKERTGFLQRVAYAVNE